MGIANPPPGARSGKHQCAANRGDPEHVLFIWIHSDRAVSGRGQEGAAERIGDYCQGARRRPRPETACPEGVGRGAIRMGLYGQDMLYVAADRVEREGESEKCIWELTSEHRG